MKSKILVVDDESAILDALQIFLEQEGYQVETVTKYDDHLVKTKAEDLTDLIILDILLMEEDGRAIAKQLKANPKTKHIPVILISAHPTAEKSAVKSSADAFLAKPFQGDVLVALIEKLTKKK